MLQGQQRTLPHWINDKHAQQTISIINGFLKISTITYCNHFSYTDEWKKVFLFQCILKTKLLKLDLAHVCISHFAVTFRYLRMLISYVTEGCCHISVVSECMVSPLRMEFIMKMKSSVKLSPSYVLISALLCKYWNNTSSLAVASAY